MHPETILFQALIIVVVILLFAVVAAFAVFAIILLLSEAIPMAKDLRKTINETIREWKQ